MNDKTATKNTYIHAETPQSCVVVGCPIEADLCPIGSTFAGLKIVIHVCQKHIGGSR